MESTILDKTLDKIAHLVTQSRHKFPPLKQRWRCPVVFVKTLAWVGVFILAGSKTFVSVDEVLK